MSEQNNVKRMNIIGVVLAIITTLVIGILGGMLIAGKNNIAYIFNPNSQKNNSNTGKEVKEVANVEFKSVFDEKRYILVFGNDKDGKEVWKYKTKEEENTGEISSIEKIGVIGDKVILNEFGTLIALDKKTGEKVWENTEYGGNRSKYTSDEFGNLYLSSYTSPKLFVIDNNGKTLKKNQSFKENLVSESDMKIENGQLTLVFPQTIDMGETKEEYNSIITMNVEDLLNIDNTKVMEKTIKPFSNYAGIESVVLDKDGNVIVNLKSESDLAKKYGEQYKVATNIKKLFMGEWGNGGYFDFIMVDESGNAKILEGIDIVENKKLELQDLENKNVDYIISISEFDAHDYAIVDKEGNIQYKSSEVLYKNNTQAEYTEEELVKMALDYYEKKNNYRPSRAATKKNDDGTISIQLYDSFSDHNSTCDWYTVDPKTGIGTNVMEEKIDLKQ